MQQAITPKLMTPDDLSERLGISTKTFAQWRCSGKGPAYLRIGKLIRYRESDVEEWLDAQRRRSTSDPGTVASKGGVQ